MQTIMCDDRRLQLDDNVAHTLLDVIALAKRDGRSFELEVPVGSGRTAGGPLVRLTITPSTRFDVESVTDSRATAPRTELRGAVPSRVPVEAHGQPFSAEDAMMIGPWDEF